MKKTRRASPSFQRRIAVRAEAMYAGAIAAAIMGALMLLLAACSGGEPGERSVASAVSGAARSRV